MTPLGVDAYGVGVYASHIAPDTGARSDKANTVTTLPAPLPASSPKLATYRVEAEVLEQLPTRPGEFNRYRTVAQGRFTDTDTARQWAAGHPGYRVTLTSYAARTGWRAELLGHRTPDGRWHRRNPSNGAVEAWAAR